MSRRPCPADAVSAAWPDQDISAFAFRCHAAGSTETATRALLDALAAQGVRSLPRYTARWTERELLSRLALAETVAEQITSRRGDLIRVRVTKRWPWRTSTSQPLPGVVA